ncbi:MAG: DUF3857 domain-containing protein, partial [candidate division KSB1 bacterium]|nr:DUF3857 domain-containing protein [candidate division KSB1 bacterium]
VDWRDLALAKLPEAKDYPDAEAVVVLDEGRVEVSGEWQMGFTLFERRRVVRIFTRRGERFANVVVPYSADSHVEMLQARAISPEGHISVVEPKRIYDVTLYPSFIFYSDQRAKLFAVPGIEPGSVVEYKYRVRIPTRSFWHSWTFQEDIPVVKSSFRVLAPGEWKVNYRVHGLEVRPRVTKAPAGFKAEYVWEVTDVPAVVRELSMPPPRESYARLELAPVGMTTWNDVAAWYNALVEPQSKVSKEISRKAREVVGDASTEWEKMKRLAMWVRDNIRYLAVEIGIGGYQPHPAAEVLANRYGDCKDVATLLCAMASAVGIETEQVLVSTWQNGVPDTSLPSPFHFNHAMVFWPAAPDSGLWIDPTDKGTPFGELPWYDQGVFVLRVKRDGTGGVVRTPRRHPAANRTAVRWYARMQEQGAAEVHGTTVLRGAPAAELRKELANLSATERARWLEWDLASRCPGIKLAAWEVQGMEPEADSVKLTYDFGSPGFAVRTGAVLGLRPAQFSLLELPSLFRSPERRFPIRFRFGVTQEFTLHLTLPQGYRLLSQALSDSLRSEHGAATWSWFPTTDGLFARIEYRLTGAEVSPTQYPAFRAFLDSVQVRDLREVHIGKR